MNIDEKLNRLNRKRKKIIFAFHELKAQNPNGKKHALIQQVAKRLDYVVDQNKSSSYVMKVIREWEKL